MPRYRVRVHETVIEEHVVDVVADDPDEAEEIAVEQVIEGETKGSFIGVRAREAVRTTEVPDEDGA